MKEDNERVSGTGEAAGPLLLLTDIGQDLREEHREQTMAESGTLCYHLPARDGRVKDVSGTSVLAVSVESGTAVSAN